MNAPSGLGEFDEAGTRAQVNWAMKATWYHALSGDASAVAHFAEQTLSTAHATQVLPSVVPCFIDWGRAPQSSPVKHLK